MLVQEKTVGLIIDIISKLQNQAEYANQAFNILQSQHRQATDPTQNEEIIRLKQSWSEHLDHKGEYQMMSQEKQYIGQDYQGSNLILEYDPPTH